jgi:hypothetical protein
MLLASVQQFQQIFSSFQWERSKKDEIPEFLISLKSKKLAVFLNATVS